MTFFKNAWPPVLLLVLLLLLAEGAVRGGFIAAYLLPAPTQVAAELQNNAGVFLAAMWQTALGAVGGFAASVVIGLPLAVLMSSFGLARRALYPYAVFFQTVPVIALAPLLVIWFGFGLMTVLASSFLVSLFPIVANSLSGLLSTDPALKDLFRLYGASSFATVFKLRLPFALPQILTGLRISGGLAVIGAIVGEFIAGGGLGAMIDSARTQQRVDVVFAAILLAAVLGLGLFAFTGLLSRLLLRHWHASERADG